MFTVHRRLISIQDYYKKPKNYISTIKYHDLVYSVGFVIGFWSYSLLSTRQDCFSAYSHILKCKICMKFSNKILAVSITFNYLMKHELLLIKCSKLIKFISSTKASLYYTSLISIWNAKLWLCSLIYKINHTRRQDLHLLKSDSYTKYED